MFALLRWLGASLRPSTQPDGSPGESLPKRVLNCLFPKSRLSVDFPLTGAKLGKTYIAAQIIFFIGSFVPGLLLVAAVFLLANFAPDDVAYRWLVVLFDPATSTFRATPLTILLLVSFISGFVPQLWYLARVLRSSGRSMFTVMGLSLDSLRGPTWRHTLRSLIFPVATAWAAIFLLEQTLSWFMPHAPEQPTVELMRQASGGNIAIWFVMAAILAPLFEELVFRGFLFQALRSTFYEWHSGKSETKAETAEQPPERSWLVRLLLSPVTLLVWPFARLGKWLAPAGKRTAGWLGRYVVNTPGRADLAAVVVSGALFALEHMQFQPVTLVLLFSMGVILAELFRRTGSLWPGILLHALNNGMVVLLIAYS